MTNLINNVNHGNSTRINAIDNNSNVNYATKAGDGNRSIKCTHVIQDFLTYLSLKQHLRICVKKTKKLLPLGVNQRRGRKIGRKNVREVSKMIDINIFPLR